jgi:hypothetical protein
MGALPIVPHYIEKLGRQHDIAVLAAFALFDPDDHALAVDGARLEADRFGNPQTRRVTDGQDHLVLQIVDGTKESRNLFLAQHDRKLFRLTAGGNIVPDNPRPFEADGEEEAERRHRNDDRAGRKTPFLRQVDQIRPDLIWSEELRRFTKWEANRTTWATYTRWVFGVRLRICISSIMRRRSGLMDNSFAREQRHMAPAHRLATELSDQTGHIFSVSQTQPSGTKQTRPRSQNRRSRKVACGPAIAARPAPGGNDKGTHAGGAVTADQTAAVADPAPAGAAITSAPVMAERPDTLPGAAPRRRLVSPETRRLYAADWAAFEDWCRQAGRLWLPADAATVAAFLTDAAATLGAGALGRRAAAIAARHRAGGHPPPTTDPAVRAVLRGARRTAAPRRPKPKPAATLIRMAARCPGDLAGMRDRALLLLAASGLGRAALVGLDVEQIRFTATAAEFFSAVSGAGAGGPPQIVIDRGANRAVCPVQALQDWLATSDTRYGPVFRKIDRWGALAHHRLGTDAIRRILARHERPHRARTRRKPRQAVPPAGGA